MSSGTHYYDYIKNEKDLREYLGADLNRMVFLLNSFNVVCEGQVEKLNSYIIEEHGVLLRKLLSDITGEETIYAYSNKSFIYFLYESCNISIDQAYKIVSKWNDKYYLNEF